MTRSDGLNETSEPLRRNRRASSGRVSAALRTVPDWFGRRSLRAQLLLTVNLIVGTGLIAFLYVDYLHGVSAAIHTKAASLADEARAIAVAIVPLNQIGPEAVQSNINAVCSAMDRTESPGHMIEVRIGDRLMQSHPSLHGEIGVHDDPGADQRVFGTATLDNVQVAVSERTSGAVRETQREAVLRAGFITAFGIVGAVVINLLLLRLVDAPIRSLTALVREIGRGQFGRPLDIGGSAETSYLATEVSAMSRELARREDDRQRQLARARQLQQHLMAPTGADGTDSSAIAFFPADEVAGDFAQVVTLDDGSVLLCLADVSGHGIAAAMGAAMIKALLLSHGLSQPTPAQLLAQINCRFLEASLPGDFASMIVVQIDASRQLATYASAGHETCYIRHGDRRISVLESTGTLLGVGKHADCQDVQFQLIPGDVIVLLSDGVSESMNEAGVLYGRSRLIDSLAATTSPRPTDVVSHVCNDAQRHRGVGRSTDDMTVLAYAIDSQN